MSVSELAGAVQLPFTGIQAVERALGAIDTLRGYHQIRQTCDHLKEKVRFLSRLFLHILFRNWNWDLIKE